MAREIDQLTAVLRVSKLNEHQAKTRLASASLKVAEIQAKIDRLDNFGDVKSASAEISDLVAKARWLSAKETFLIPLQATKALCSAEHAVALQEAAMQAATVRVIEAKLKTVLETEARRVESKRQESLIEARLCMK